MFSNLVESGRKPRRPLGQAVCSLAFHVVVGVGAVEASRHVAQVDPRGPLIDTTIYVIEKRRPPPAAPAAAPRSAATLEAPGATSLPFDPAAIAPPEVIPGDLPALDRGAIGPSRFVAAPAATCRVCGPGDGGPATIHRDDTVDTPAEIVSQARPVYPPSLRAAGLAGRVVLRFVVDTSGRVEPGSIVMLEPAHPAFEKSAIDAVTGARFRPARLRGRPVRQLVTQGVTFRIE